HRDATGFAVEDLACIATGGDRIDDSANSKTIRTADQAVGSFCLVGVQVAPGQHDCIALHIKTQSQMCGVPMKEPRKMARFRDTPGSGIPPQMSNFSTDFG